MRRPKLSWLKRRKKKRSEKKDSKINVHTYAYLDKGSVLQQIQTLNETRLNSRKCKRIITKLLFLFMRGEHFNRQEATEAFFAVTKVWQCKDTNLHRLVYLAIKEMANIADDVIVVTSSLIKDMTGKEDIHRAPAIRALTKIASSNMLQTIELHMKQAIIDSNGGVSSALLVSSYHLMTKREDIVNRWVTEVEEAIYFHNHMVQYHGLGLLYQLIKKDKLAIRRVAHNFSKSGLCSPYAICLLIRIIAKLLLGDDRNSAELVDFVSSCLRHKSEMVVYEAASTFIELPNTTQTELAPAISVLQQFCSSSKPSFRLAAVRTLNKVAEKHAIPFMSCNVDLEKLITDKNSSIAKLAISTLLKIGTEDGVGRLMKQISSLMKEITDEYKTVIVEVVYSIFYRYPRMLPFLAKILKEDGRLEYKIAIVETIITLFERNDDKEIAVFFEKQSMQKYLNDIIRITFVVSTISKVALWTPGLTLLNIIINHFSSVCDMDFPEQSILEQYEAQISTAILAVISAEAPEEEAKLGCQVAANWLSSGVVDNTNLLRRVYQPFIIKVAQELKKIIHDKISSLLHQLLPDVLTHWNDYSTATQNSHNLCIARINRLAKIYTAEFKQILISNPELRSSLENALQHQTGAKETAPIEIKTPSKVKIPTIELKMDFSGFKTG